MCQPDEGIFFYKINDEAGLTGSLTEVIIMTPTLIMQP